MAFFGESQELPPARYKDYTFDDCYRIWKDVLIQAVDDLTIPMNSTISRYNSAAWFLSNSTQPGSFLWVCSLLSISPSRLRSHHSHILERFISHDFEPYLLYRSRPSRGEATIPANP